MRERNSFNDLKSNLNENDIDQLVELLGSRVRSQNLAKLRRRLEQFPNLVPSYGILERLTKTEGTWEYTAGQSYPDEIRTVREIILNLK
jgi:hypothetical protein